MYLILLARQESVEALDREHRAQFQLPQRTTEKATPENTKT